MTQAVVALLGLSGVGKSTLLHALASDVTFQHLQASAVIKAARDTQALSSLSVDELRRANIDDNQALLIAGFAAARDPSASLIVLDGHSVIDAPQGLVRIPPGVFAQLGIQLVIFLADDAGAIAARRQQDPSRQRPNRTTEELEQHQADALASAFLAARHLNTPLMVFSPSHIEDVRRVLTHAATGMRDIGR
jgi:adenylate kinase